MYNNRKYTGRYTAYNNRAQRPTVKINWLAILVWTVILVAVVGKLVGII